MVERQRPSGYGQWSGKEPGRCILAGIEPGQDHRVLQRAAELAVAMEAGLRCLWVDSTQIIFDTGADGSILSTPLDPDQLSADAVVLEPDLLDLAAQALAASPVSWRLDHTSGDIATGLAKAAHQWDAAMVVVGTRRPGFAGWMNEVVGGSIAARLAHTQDRPVLLVPVHVRTPKG